MSEKGKDLAIAKAKVKPEGDMFADQLLGTQEQRRSCQAFLKMLTRNKKANDDGFVRWVDYKARQECGPFYDMVQRACKDKLVQNEQRREKFRKLGVEIPRVD